MTETPHPREDRMTLTYKYRVYPTSSQVKALELHLSEACRLYNAAIAERRGAWRLQRTRVSFAAQARQLKDIRAAGDLGIPCAQVAHSVLKRVDRAFAGFFRRVQAGGRAGYPRFKPRARYDSIDFVIGNGATLLGTKRLNLSGIGALKVKWHREFCGEPKAVTISREGVHWFACIAVHLATVNTVAIGPSVGVDVGLLSLATLSDGTIVPNPRLTRAAERRLRVAQRILARRRKGSRRRKSAAALVASHHRTIRRQRSDAHHKASRSIVNRVGSIAVEDLNIKGLARARFAKSVHDAGWRSLLDKLRYKAAKAGVRFEEVSAAGTSQTCLCGARVPKTLADRWHHCDACGLSAPRDLVSAQLIERLGRSRWALTDSREVVAHEA